MSVHGARAEVSVERPQADTPGGDKEANWLPVAEKPFTLLMRLYSTKSEFLAGSWTPPLVQKTN